MTNQSWERLPGLFKFEEFAHVTEFEREFHAEPAFTDDDGEMLFRIFHKSCAAAMQDDVQP